MRQAQTPYAEILIPEVVARTRMWQNRVGDILSRNTVP
jgi:hypothetical protein